MNMDFERVLKQIQENKDRVSVAVFTGADYTSSRKGVNWDCQIKFAEGSTRVEISQMSNDLTDAIVGAWNQLSRLITPTMPNALTPAIEHHSGDH